MIFVMGSCSGTAGPFLPDTVFCEQKSHAANLEI